MSTEYPKISTSQLANIGKCLSISILDYEYVTSGAANHVFRVKSDSETFIAKMSKVSKPNLFRYEEESLVKIAETNTVHVPNVIHSDEDFLAMEDLGYEYKEITEKDWNVFGCEFGEMHRVSNNLFGYQHDNYLGIWDQVNTEDISWLDFFYKNRVSCYFDVGRNSSILTNDDRDGIWNIMEKMRDIVPDQKPALCHGDFWINNIFRTKSGKVYVIDPAVHFGLPEADLAMTQMYEVFPDAFYSGYNESYGLLPGWKDRCEVYQIKELLLMIAQFEHADSVKKLRELIRKYR